MHIRGASPGTSRMIGRSEGRKMWQKISTEFPTEIVEHVGHFQHRNFQYPKINSFLHFFWMVYIYIYCDYSAARVAQINGWLPVYPNPHALRPWDHLANLPSDLRGEKGEGVRRSIRFGWSKFAHVRRPYIIVSCSHDGVLKHRLLSVKQWCCSYRLWTLFCS